MRAEGRIGKEEIDDFLFFFPQFGAWSQANRK